MSGTSVPLIRAAGSPFDVGYQHGSVRREQLRAFIDDDLCRINRLIAEPVSARELSPVLAQYGSVLKAAVPRLSAEIDGLASGAGISRDLAVLLQVRRELIGYQKIPVPARGDCTTYASLTAGPDGTPVLAQTVDLNGDLDDHIAVLDVELDGSPRRSLVLSFGGLLGYLGVNSDGLAIGLNLVLGGQWRPGVPPYLAIRHLLDNAGRVQDALALLRELPIASSRSLTLLDRTGAAWVEILGDEQRVTRAPQVSHTNHYLDPDFAGHDQLNVFARNFSRQRLKACDSGLAGFAARPAAGAGVDEHFGLLSRPPVCVPGNGDIRRERTVAAVVLLPERGELHVRPGDPSRSSTRAFRLPAAARQEVVA